MGRKRKLAGDGADDNQVDLPPKHLKSMADKEQQRLIVVLENAQLDSAKVNSTSTNDVKHVCLPNSLFLDWAEL